MISISITGIKMERNTGIDLLIEKNINSLKRRVNNMINRVIRFCSECGKEIWYPPILQCFHRCGSKKEKKMNGTIKAIIKKYKTKGEK